MSAIHPFEGARPASATVSGRPVPPLARRAALLSLGIAVAILATMAGLHSARWAMDAQVAPSAVRAGPWLGGARPSAGRDPYLAAAAARSGAAPLAPGEGLSFTARTDSGGRALDPECTYRVVGRIPPARMWTLSLYEIDGSLPRNPLDRHGFTGAEAFRAAGRPVEVQLSRTARPGNWLPFGEAREPVLVLRLYDTPTGALSDTLTADSLPRIEALPCP